MKIFVTLAIVLAVLGALDALDSPQKLFGDFIKKYNRHYGSRVEHQMRFTAFVKTLERIKQLQESEDGTAEYGINKFADFTLEELQAMGGINLPEENVTVLVPTKHHHHHHHHHDLPKSFDWRDFNNVTAVKDQGRCENSWAFSVAATIEGLFALRYQNLVPLSEQMLTDCDNKDGHCHGKGLPLTAFKEIMNTIGGIAPTDEYPYVGHDQNCYLNDPDQIIVIFPLDTIYQLSKDETKVAEWLVKNGTVSVVLNGDALYHYKRGIIDNRDCRGGHHKNFAATLVGYGYEHDHDYWIVKNSFGKDWGEKGYFRLARGHNVCGVAEMATSAHLTP